MLCFFRMQGHNTTHLIIRSDASPTMGTGHVMRCLALAQWAMKLSIPCTIMGRFQVPWVRTKLEGENIDYIALSGKIPKEENPKELLQNLSSAPKGSWLVLDGYHFTLKCQEAVRKSGYKLLIIDDYAHLPKYSCDILLNQNIGAKDLVYNGDIGQKCLGLEYVLLRQEFIEARTQAEKRVYPETPQNILLTLGGGDFSIHLNKIAHLFAIPEMRGLNLRIIAGAMNEDNIKQILKDCLANIEILHSVHDMPALFLSTDLCISAGGSTCWELCCLGVPFLTVEVAENQHEIVMELDRKNIAHPLKDVSLQEMILEQNYMKMIKQVKSSSIDGKSLECIAQLIQEI